MEDRGQTWSKEKTNHLRATAAREATDLKGLSVPK